MPNLNLIQALHSKYDAKTPDKFEQVAEYLQVRTTINTLEKGLDLNQRPRFILEMNNAIGAEPDLIKYFEANPKEEIALIFIDITNFSEKFTEYSNDQIQNVLSAFYRSVIPLIYKHGGEIEKIIGDGIIAIFGKPFLDESVFELCETAEKCSSEIISTLKGTKSEVKVALHYGEIKYYKIPTGYYEEYTIIGTTLTELHRLESVSENNSINFYNDSVYSVLFEQKLTPLSKSHAGWTFKTAPVRLKGVDYNFVNWLQKI